jgi:hypothetical protein
VPAQPLVCVVVGQFALIGFEVLTAVSGVRGSVVG